MGTKAVEKQREPSKWGEGRSGGRVTDMFTLGHGDGFKGVPMSNFRELYTLDICGLSCQF